MQRQLLRYKRKTKSAHGSVPFPCQAEPSPGHICCENGIYSGCCSNFKLQNLFEDNYYPTWWRVLILSRQKKSAKCVGYVSTAPCTSANYVGYADPFKIKQHTSYITVLNTRLPQNSSKSMTVIATIGRSFSFQFKPTFFKLKNLCKLIHVHRKSKTYVPATTVLKSSSHVWQGSHVCQGGCIMHGQKFQIQNSRHFGVAKTDHRQDIWLIIKARIKISYHDIFNYFPWVLIREASLCFGNSRYCTHVGLLTLLRSLSTNSNKVHRFPSHADSDFGSFKSPPTLRGALNRPHSHGHKMLPARM